MPGALALLAEAVATCRALRLDELAYLLVSQAVTTSYSTDEGVEETLAEAEALMDTADLRLHSASIRADIALRAGRYEDAVTWLDVAREILRSLPGAVPVDALCWRVWAFAAAKRPAEAAEALEEARQMPDLARWYGRPVVLAAGAALLEGDEEGVDRAIAAAPGIMPMDIALMRLVGADVIGGPSRVRWLREALDTYEKAGAPFAADRVRQALREAGGPVPRRRRQPSAVPRRARRGRRDGPRGRRPPFGRRRPAQRRDRGTAVRVGANRGGARFVASRQAQRAQPGPPRDRGRSVIRLGLVVPRM